MANGIMTATRASARSRRRCAVLIAVAALMSSAVPAQANTSGQGTFEGLEYPPAAILQMPPITLCAEFDPTQPYDPDADPPEPESGPLVHELDMDGSFHGVTGMGTATFTGPYPGTYYANPTGTYSDPLCTQPYAVPGEVDITFQGDSTTFTCSGDGSYQRLATSVYRLTFDGTCNNGGGATSVEFLGTQVPCTPATPCSDPDAGAFMDGAYVQS